MATVGAFTVTVRCGACREALNVAIHSTPVRCDGTVTLHVDEPDVVLLQMWAGAHRGPVIAA